MKIAVRGTRLFVDVEGLAWRWDGNRLRHFPPLFLLHGGPGGNHTGLKKDLGFLRRWFQLFFIDHRGCGLSDRCPTRTLNLNNNVEDIEALRKQFGFDRISILGSSYGGMVTATYAARYPRNLQLLFLLGTAGSGDFLYAAQEYLRKHGNETQIRVAQRLWKGEFRSQAQLANYFKHLGPLYRRRPAPNPVRKQIPRMQFNLDALNVGFREILPKWNVLPALRRVRVPAFIAVGKYDWICPVSQSVALARHLPVSTLKIYPHAAHSPSGDEPKRFRKDVEAFVRRWDRKL
jgi:proline iminopeptidase